MLLFRGEEHIDRWCSVRDLSRGATLTPEQGWRLACQFAPRAALIVERPRGVTVDP